MNSDILKNKKIEFNKNFSEYKRTGRIAECFYHNKSECKGIIKQSHSIQRNGRLSIIEGEVNSNKVIYTFTEIEFDYKGNIKSLIPIGKGTASTFFGFCDFHDSALFAPIENFPFDNSDKHCFLHSYRAFAHSYHKKKEQLKAFESDSNYTKSINPNQLTQLILSVREAIDELEINKRKLDSQIDCELYNYLEYFTYIIPEKYPIACSSIINPYYSYYGTAMDIQKNGYLQFSHIMITILPDDDQTIIIFASFPEDKKGILFLNELHELKDYQLDKAISSILISCAENTFFAPALWDKLGEEGQIQLCNELNEYMFSVPSTFKHSRTNFFENKFSAKNLKLL